MKIISKTQVFLFILQCYLACIASKFLSLSSSKASNNQGLTLTDSLSETSDYRQATTASTITPTSGVPASVNIGSKHPFILNSKSFVGKHRSGLMTSSGSFLTCEIDSTVLSSKKWFLHLAELNIGYISEDATQETVTVTLMSSMFGCYIEIVPYTEINTAPALKCQSKAITESCKITFKKFGDGYYIVTESKKYISFEESPVYTNDFLGSALIYSPFKLPARIPTFGYMNDPYCRNLDCDRVVLKFKACNSYLGINSKSLAVPEYFILQAFQDNYINLSVGSNYITITPNKSLSFEVQVSTVYSLLKLIKLNDNELALMGYGGKYLECKDGLVYLSDGLSLNSKIVPSS